jgi:hypothetical protein
MSLIEVKTLNKYIIPSFSGENKYIIYFLISNETIVYVGQTECGLRRIGGHFGFKDFDSFTFTPAPSDKNERLKLEEQYILKYQPKYNKITERKTLISKGYISIDCAIKKYYNNLSNKLKYNDFKKWLIGLEVSLDCIKLKSRDGWGKIDIFFIKSELEKEIKKLI